jgi:hypothetical protein
MSKPIVHACRVFFFTVACVALIGVPASDRPAEDDAAPAQPPAVVFPALYVSFAALQVLDIDSTMRAVRDGGREANPVIGMMVESTAVLVATKAAATIGVVILTERLRKRHPTAALLVMIGLNSAYGTVAAHNYGVAAAGRGR